MASKGSQTPSYWYDGSAVPFAARLLAPLYAGVVAARRALYRRRWLKRHALPVPVIVVGNVTAGGTGKTPLTIALVQRLREAGWKPGVASRGYGREQANVPRWVEATTDTALGGDEPVLIAWKTGVPVRVDADRVAAGRALVEAGCDIIVCDDGLQHYRLARDIEIEVVDAQPARCVSRPAARRNATSGSSTSARPVPRPRRWPHADSANGPCSCTLTRRNRSAVAARARWRISVASACMPWPASRTRSVSSTCCARTASVWCRMPLPTTMPTRHPTCASAANCRC
jgi:hypothetical protein